MTKKELLDIEELLVEVDTSDDKIEALENLYFHILKEYRRQGKEKLGSGFRDDL